MINGVVAPFDHARLGWALLDQGAAHHPSNWVLVTLAAAALVFTGKLAVGVIVVAAWRT